MSSTCILQKQGPHAFPQSSQQWHGGGGGLYTPAGSPTILTGRKCQVACNRAVRIFKCVAEVLSGIPQGSAHSGFHLTCHVH